MTHDTDKPISPLPARPAVTYAALAASAVLLLLMAVPMLGGRVPVADDLGEFHLPARAFYAKCLTQGHAFDWWPQVYGGVYLTGEGQAGTYHPLHLLLYRSLPLPQAFALEVWLNYPFMLIGMYLWLQTCLGRRDLALFGGLVFTFCGFNLLHIVHVNAIAVVAHIPWLLWAIDLTLDERGHRTATGASLIALLTGSQLLLGYPQYVWFSLLAQALYIGWRLTPSRLAIVAAANLTGLLIGAVQWLPTLDALNRSIRHSVDTAFVESGSLHPLNLIQLVAPYLFETRVVGQNTHELGLYLGAVPLMLVAWLVCCGRPASQHRRLVACCGGLAALALLLALGSHGYLYRLQTYLPVVGKFRFPCRTIVLFYLGMAALSAVALSALLQGSGDSDPAAMRRPKLIWGLAGIALLAAVAGPLLWPAHIAAWPLVATGPVLFVLAAWLIERAQRGSAWAAVALVLLTAADLGAYGLSYAALPGTARYEQFVSNTDQPPATSKGRVALDVGPRHLQSTQAGNRVVLAGWHRIGGYLGLPPQKMLDYRETNALRVAGVRWVADLDRADAGRWNIDYREVDRPLPSVRLVTRSVTTDDPAGSIGKISVHNTALVDTPLALPTARPGDVSIQREAPGQLFLLTKSSSPQLLTVAQSYHPGWKAQVDGHPVPVRRVYGDFVGCVVPAGQHRIELAFQPQSLKTGLTLSLCGLGLLVCGFLATHYGQPKT